MTDDSDAPMGVQKDDGDDGPDHGHGAARRWPIGAATQWSTN
ncbi:hypothetical protein [Mycobacterium sp. DL440]|nr:hypothetical protein [Mycobacterium sp. DL440]